MNAKKAGKALIAVSGLKPDAQTDTTMTKVNKELVKSH